MKNIKISLLLIAILYTGVQDAESQTKYIVEIGTIDSLYSNVLKDSREFYVHLPEGFDAGSKKEYPVLYVLDADFIMDAATTVYKYYWGGFMPEMVIIGIANLENRNRDLISDSAEYFMSFLQKELIPHIEANYPVTGYRSLIGHSYGGYFTINSLINNSELFENYLAIDPSLDFDGHRLLNQAKESFSTKNFEGKSLYISLGGQLHMQNEEINIDNVMQDSSEFTLFARSNIELAESAKTNAQNGLNIRWKYYPDDLHMTVVLPSIRDGLIYLFEWFQMENTAMINNPDTPVDELEKVVRHRAKKLEAHFGYKHPPYDEELLNMLGYMNLEMGFPERSLAFFLFGIEYFPLSANAYDSLADYYVAQKDFKNALKYVSIAFELSGSDYHKERMQEYMDTATPNE